MLYLKKNFIIVAEIPNKNTKMADLLGDDPAAEFLQQEEDQLRELGIDENQFEGGDVGDDVLGGDVIVPDNNGGAGNDIMGEFEADVPAQQPVANGFAEPAASVIQLQPDEEPESLKVWRDEKEASLQQQVWSHFFFQ